METRGRPEITVKTLEENLGQILSRIQNLEFQNRYTLKPYKEELLRMMIDVETREWSGSELLEIEKLLNTFLTNTETVLPEGFRQEISESRDRIKNKNPA